MAAPAHYRQPRFQPGPTAKPRASAVGGGASPYQLGKRFERATRGRLERRGYFVMRAGLSKGHKAILPDGTEAHSKLDLFAVKSKIGNFERVGEELHATVTHLVLGVQCKRRGDIGSAEWNELIAVCEPFGIMPVVACKSGERTTSFYRLDAPREKGKPGRPWTEIDPATCEPVPVQMPLA